MEKTQIWTNAEQFLSLIYCIFYYFGSYSSTIAKQTCPSTRYPWNNCINVCHENRWTRATTNSIHQLLLRFPQLFFSCESPLFTIIYPFFVTHGSRASFNFYPKWGDMNVILFLVHGISAHLIYICGFSHWFHFKIPFFVSILNRFPSL